MLLCKKDCFGMIAHPNTDHYRFLLMEPNPRQKKIARQKATQSLWKANQNELATDETGKTFVAIVDWLLFNAPNPIAAWDFCQEARRSDQNGGLHRALAEAQEIKKL
jgi:hypothetical protein